MLQRVYTEWFILWSDFFYSALINVYSQPLRSTRPVWGLRISLQDFFFPENCIRQQVNKTKNTTEKQRSTRSEPPLLAIARSDKATFFIWRVDRNIKFCISSQMKINARFWQFLLNRWCCKRMESMFSQVWNTVIVYPLCISCLWLHVHSWINPSIKLMVSFLIPLRSFCVYKLY